ncbi:MAG: hypothetical protein ACE5LH_09605 [Fidelibacterota bacterium]
MRAFLFPPVAHLAALVWVLFGFQACLPGGFHGGGDSVSAEVCPSFVQVPGEAGRAGEDPSRCIRLQRERNRYGREAYRFYIPVPRWGEKAETTPILPVLDRLQVVFRGGSSGWSKSYMKNYLPSSEFADTWIIALEVSREDLVRILSQDPLDVEVYAGRDWIRYSFSAKSLQNWRNLVPMKRPGRPSITV